MNRSASLSNRNRHEILAYKHGYIRLLEHDRQTSRSSTGSGYYPRISYIDEPTLEINQITRVEDEAGNTIDDGQVERSISTT